MVAVLVLGNAGGSFVANLGLLLVCVALGFGVQHAAPAIHALRGWRKVLANAAMTLAVIVVLIAVGQPQMAQAAVSILYECGCWWWGDLCCYI